MDSDEDLRRVHESCRRRYESTHPKPKNAVHIKAGIEAVFSSLDLRRRFRERDISAALHNAVGESAASHCRFAGVTRGVVRILVDSSACLHELANFRKREVLAGLRSQKDFAQIHDVEFRLGTLEQQ